MDTVTLIKGEGNKLNKSVKNMKRDLKSKTILLKDKNNKKFNKAFSKKRPIRKAKAVIYLGHIPHGFYENEMMAYFSQFGKVLSATVARSKKTGRSRGFGFVEFQNEEVAKIAAETMNNYLMYNRILKCKYIPPEERKINYTKIDEFDYPKKKHRKISLKIKNAINNQMNKSYYQAQAKKKILQFKKFFEEKGIDFSIEVNNTLNNAATLVKKSSDSINETDDQIGILEIDESDNDIHFTTPPHVKKVIIKSSNSSITKKLNETNENLKAKVKNKSSAQTKRKKDDCFAEKPIKRFKKIKQIAVETIKSKSSGETKTKKLDKSAINNKKQLKSKNLKTKSKSIEAVKSKVKFKPQKKKKGEKKLLKS